MFHITERAMIESERERLLDCMPLAPRPFHSRQFKLNLVSELIGVVVAIVCILYLKKESPAFVIPAALGLYALWWLLHLKGRVLSPIRQWREANQIALRFHDAVTSAQSVCVHCVEAKAAVRVTCDEGTIYLMDVGPNRTYWIDPYSMIPGRPPKNWPNRKFEVVKVPGWNGEIGPFCAGKSLHLRETYEFRDLFEQNDFEPPAGGLIGQALDAFLAEAKSRNQKANAT